MHQRLQHQHCQRLRRPTILLMLSLILSMMTSIPYLERFTPSRSTNNIENQLIHAEEGRGASTAYVPCVGGTNCFRGTTTEPGNGGIHYHDVAHGCDTISIHTLISRVTLYIVCINQTPDMPVYSVVDKSKKKKKKNKSSQDSVSYSVARR